MSGATRKNGKRTRRGCRKPGLGFKKVTCAQCGETVTKRSTLVTFPGRKRRCRTHKKEETEA